MGEPWVYENRRLDIIPDRPVCEACGDDHFSVVVYDREHPEYYPLGSEMACEGCGARYGRWSNRRLHGQEAEKRYGYDN